MGQEVFGLDAKLFRNTATYETPTWVEITNVKDVTLTLNKSEADLSTRGNGGWRAIKGVMKEASVEFQMVWNKSDAAFQAIKAAWFAGTSLDLAVMDGPITGEGSVGSEGLRARWDVIGFTRNEPLEEALTVDVTIKPTYDENPPVWMTVAAGP